MAAGGQASASPGDTGRQGTVQGHLQSSDVQPRCRQGSLTAWIFRAGAGGRGASSVTGMWSIDLNPRTLTGLVVTAPSEGTLTLSPL